MSRATSLDRARQSLEAHDRQRPSDDELSALLRWQSERDALVSTLHKARARRYGARRLELRKGQAREALRPILREAERLTDEGDFSRAYARADEALELVYSAPGLLREALDVDALFARILPAMPASERAQLDAEAIAWRLGRESDFARALADWRGSLSWREGELVAPGAVFCGPMAGRGETVEEEAERLARDAAQRATETLEQTVERWRREAREHDERLAAHAARMLEERGAFAIDSDDDVFDRQRERRRELSSLLRLRSVWRSDLLALVEAASDGELSPEAQRLAGDRLATLLDDIADDVARARQALAHRPEEALV